MESPKKEEINGIMKKDQLQMPEKTEKSGLLASMLLQKKEATPHITTMVNGELEEYKKLNGNKRPASAEPLEEASMPKKPHMEPLASNGDSNRLQTIMSPEGSTISTTAGGQKVLTTPDGKQMIVKVAPNGTQMVIGTIEATPATPSPPPPTVTSPVPTTVGTTSPQNSPRPLVNGQVNGNSSTSMSPESPKSATSSPSSSSGTTSTSTTSVSSLSVTTIPKPNPALPFLCEWKGCMKAFKTPKDVEKHAISSHCPLGSDDIPCLWQRCDAMKRKRFSLMTHLQDRHCHPQVCSNNDKVPLDGNVRG